MNWGLKIAIVYTGFVLLIGSMVFISVGNKSELVARDYYAQELDYQQRIDAMSNERILHKSITHFVSADSIQLSFPVTDIAKDFEGELYFFRPSDMSKDVKLKLSFDANGEQRISKKQLAKGLYKMCISWKNHSTSFYKEEIIHI
jgi:hypothetical protein